MPHSLKNKVPNSSRRRFTPRLHARKMLMPSGCVQPAMMPNITRHGSCADAAGIQTVVAASRLLRRGEIPPERPGRY
jgi:glycolate oxidase iron-sulfur subunit